jgi:hypothetical protein
MKGINGLLEKYYYSMQQCDFFDDFGLLIQAILGLCCLNALLSMILKFIISKTIFGKT